MKKTLVSLLLLCSIIGANAQNLKPGIQTLMDACISLRTAIAAGDIDGLRSANKTFKSVKTVNFSGFRPVQPAKFASLKNHFIFEPEFVDSLIKLGKGKVYKYADKYATNGSAVRGTASQGVYIKNIVLKKKSTQTYKMIGDGHMELVFVTEPKGLISVTIYDKKHKVYYKEHEKERQGAAYRVHTFDLPQDGNAELQVSIQNVSKKDVSCVVMCE